MEIAFLLIPLAVILVFVVLGGLWWAIQTGQFEDLEEEGSRILEQDWYVSNHKSDITQIISLNIFVFLVLEIGINFTWA